MHVNDGMASKERVTKALRDVLTCWSERTCIAVQRRQDDRTACLERDAGRIGEFLQGDDVGIELGDDRCDAFRVVASVSADARVHVVRSHPHYSDRLLTKLRAGTLLG